MSRIGKRPISVPKQVTLTINGQQVIVKGPKGELSRVLPPEVVVEQDGETVNVKRASESRTARQRHGLCRTLVFNMVEIYILCPSGVTSVVMAAFLAFNEDETVYVVFAFNVTVPS